MKFIHAADIHLDSPLVGLQRYEGAPIEEIRGATRRALENLVELAITESVDFILISGDLYDGDWKDYNTGLFFAAQMGKLRENGIKVFIISGNHDAVSQITKFLRFPENVKQLSVHKTESLILDDLSVVIHGRGFHSRTITENMVKDYPPPIPHLFNIGMLHTSAEGREGHEIYAPCSLQDLLSKNYDYWALGHVHKYEVLHKEPWVLFPGNIQGRHSRETGAKGCLLVTVEDGKVFKVEQRELDVLRWSICKVDAAESPTIDDAMERVVAAVNRELSNSDGRSLAVRLQIDCSSGARSEISADIEQWVNQIRAMVTDLSSGRVWIEKVKISTHTTTSLGEALGRDDALGGLLRAVHGLNLDDRLFVSLKKDLTDLMSKLPPELRTGEEAIDLENPQLLQQVTEDVKQLLFARILSSEKGNL
ncbi:MAG: DNA repair exonuclease [Candidatus Tectomicrobia bacterium]|uniref:DNA repair exonuclease n=1 Tax=Tectimicrobiota bacterium TaxID=2528274 RepID=A0A933GJV2_UNCTE|nr:DNA repair exonuclease [Candidatus Tectomicrobia bacterium]